MNDPVKFKPFKHQKKMIKHMTSRDRSAVFAGMGLGKSSATLRSIKDMMFTGKCRGALIVAPLRVANYTWGLECQKWDFSRFFRLCNLRPAIKYVNWVNKTKLAEKNDKPKPYLSKRDQEKGKASYDMWNEGKADIYLINYEMLQQFSNVLLQGRKQIHCNTLVLDESTFAKNPSSKRINQFRKHLYHFDIRIELTGTPLPNGYLDMFAPIRLLDDGESLGKYITHYKRKYFHNPDGQGFKWVLNKGSKELIEEAMSNLTITLSSEDYLKIPEVEYHDVEVNLPTQARKQYREMEKEFLIELEGGDVPAVSAAALTNKLLQLSSGAVYDEDGVTRELHDEKIRTLQSLVSKIREKGETVLIACAYKHEQQRILSAIPEAQMFSEDALDDWNNGDVPVWLADYRSIAHGLNLQDGGRNIIWFTPTYSFESYDQFNARLARTGQKHRTVIHRLITTDTIDEAVVEALRFKKEGQNGLMDSLKILEYMRKD